MRTDVRETLERGAAPPRVATVDVDALWEQARQRRRRRTGVTVGVTLTIVAVVVALAVVTFSSAGRGRSVRVPPAGAGQPNAVTVVAREYSFALRGAPRAGWNQITLSNDGRDYHNLALVALKPGVTAGRLRQAFTRPAALAAITVNDGVITGLPAAVGPGERTATITRLGAGHYGIISTVRQEDAKLDVTHGMVKVFDVAPVPSNLALPVHAPSITITDTSITVPAVAAGELTAAVTNTGTAEHSFFLVRMKPGRSLDEAKAYFDLLLTSQPLGADPPAVIVGGTSGLAPGSTAYLVQDLTPGHYGYASTDGTAPDDDYSNGLHGEFDVG